MASVSKGDERTIFLSTCVKSCETIATVPRSPDQDAPEEFGMSSSGYCKCQGFVPNPCRNSQTRLIFLVRGTVRFRSNQS